ncbi:MAG TPA: shikimate kinase [Desulfobacterales bacterium]|nr:shikimate kinase [Desulfobacterales bacterium]
MNMERKLKPFPPMRLSLIGMAGSGKSYWSMKLAEHGFRRFGCDELIAEKLAHELFGSDGRSIETGEWMGFPYERQYKKHESKYLAYEKRVLSEILYYLQNPKIDRDEHIVVDTTGSVIYTGREMMEKLRQNTIVIFLSTPPEVQKQLLNAYITNLHPMLWRDVFHKKPNETNQKALARCYPRLFSERERLYFRYADFTIDYHSCRKDGFGANDFLNKLR